MRARIGVCLLLLACGGRTPLGTRDAGATDAAAAGDAPASGVECTWNISGPSVRISADPAEVAGDVGLEDAVPTTGGALVTWVTPGDKTHPQTAVARLVAFDLVSNGDEHVVLRAPDVVSPLRYVSLGNGFGHVAVTAWDGSHCVLRPITVDGASNGTMVGVSASACEGFEATVPGFDLLQRGSPLNGVTVELLRLDPSGAPLGPSAFVLSTGPGALGEMHRATLADGSFVAAAPADGKRVIATHRDAHGASLGTVEVVVQGTNIVMTMLSIAPVTGGAMVAWVDFGGVAHARVSPLRADASPVGAPLVAAASTVSITAIDLAPDVTGGALFAWTEYAPSLSHVQLVSLSPAGAPRGAPVAVPDAVPGAKYGPAVHVVTTGKQGLVLFEAFSDATLHRVYAAPLACTP